MRSTTRLTLLAAILATSVVSSAFADGRPTLPGVPHLDSLAGGLRIANLRYPMPPSLTPSLAAYPLLSPPVTGFTALVGVSLTDQQGPDDLDFYAIKSTSRVGNVLPVNGTGVPYTYLATLDSGAQSHILSSVDAAGVNIASAGRAGNYTVDVQGASGTESLDITDPLGVFVTGINNVSMTGGRFNAPASSYVGQIHTSVLTAESGSQLPSVIGGPMLANYAVNIRNTATRRIVTPNGTAVRSPTVDFVAHGAATQYQYKLALSLQDPLGANSTEPAFFPSFENFDDFSDNPTAPTFWTFPIANANLQHTGSLQQQQFLFDTGAQVTVLSEETADSVGFDVETDTPDFTVDVLGVGGTQQAKGFFLQRLELPVTGGSAIFNDVPVIVLDVTDPRDGSGTIPGILGMNLFTDRDLAIDMNRSGQSYVRFGNAVTAQWKVDGNGAWLPDANWDLGVPDGADLPANFLGTITAARTVTVDGDYTIGSMTFDNANGYTLAGSGRLTFATLGRPSKIEVVRGSQTVASPLTFDARQNLIVAAGATLTLSGDTATSTATVTKSGAGQLRLKDARYASLAITAGSVQLLAGGSPNDGSVVHTLTIAAGASLDLTNRRMAIDYDAASPIADVRTNLAAGRILSSTAGANGAVGYGEAAALSLTTFGGIPLQGDAIVLRATLKGDANLDLAVNFADLLALAQSYGLSNRVWTQGDSTYDGVVNFEDLLALAQNYGATTSLSDAARLAAVAGDPDFAADWALAQSLIPEPTTLTSVIATAIPALRRRRRHRAI